MSSLLFDIADLKLCTEFFLPRNYDKVARYFGLYQCCLCRKYPSTLCDTCSTKFFYSLPECSVCSIFSHTGEVHHICQSSVLAYTYSLSLYQYTKLIKSLFAVYKYKSAFQYQHVFEKMTTAYFQSDPFLVLREWEKILQNKKLLMLPVPMTKRKQEERGFSPAYELAIIFGRQMSKWYQTKVQICTRLLSKNRDSVAQARKNRQQRLLSLAKSYSLCIDLVDEILHKQFEAICIVDDVLTTGATTTTLLDQLGSHPRLKKQLKRIPLFRLTFASA